MCQMKGISLYLSFIGLLEIWGKGMAQLGGIKIIWKSTSIHNNFTLISHKKFPKVSKE